MAAFGVCTLNECTWEDVPETIPSLVEMVCICMRVISGERPE